MNTHPLAAFRRRQDPPLSQQDLAELLAVQRVTISRWESGTRKIDIDRVPDIAEKTGIAPAELRPDLAEKMLMRAAE